MQYQVISRGVDNRRFIPFGEDLQKHIKERDEADYYKSIFIYSEEHKKQHEETKSVAGINDVITNILLWDFDDENDLEQARKDSLELCGRLHAHSIPIDQIRVYFSGNKGFHVEVEFEKRLTQPEFKFITANLASDLKSYDTRINDCQRLIRLEYSKHNKSGLFKIPLSLEELQNLSLEDIRFKAKDFNPDIMEEHSNKWKQILLPNTIYLLKDKMPKRELVAGKVAMQDVSELDFANKMKGLTNCKFAILNGFFQSGQRHEALMALCASLKGNSVPKEINYNMLKAADRLRILRTGDNQYPKREIWSMVESVYSPHWNGGTYTCKEPSPLQDICLSLGRHSCTHDKDENIFVEVGDVFDNFKKFAKEIDQNTIKTGLPLLDEKLRITTSSLNFILGCPGSGKTSMMLNILNNTSKQGIPSIFYSMDMSSPLLIQKMLHKLQGGGTSKKLFEIFQGEDTEKIDAFFEKLKNEYANVKFDFRSGQTVEDIRRNIIRHQEKLGIKIKLVAIDYAECLAGPFSDSVANTQIISNQLRDMSNELGICTILLVQPQKSAGDICDPILSMRKIKGSSSLEQNASLIMGIYREGFNPQIPHEDKFLTINILKNRMGEHFSQDFAWNGAQGMITIATDEQLKELEMIRQRKKNELSASKSDGLWD